MRQLWPECAIPFSAQGLKLTFDLRRKREQEGEVDTGGSGMKQDPKKAAMC